MTRLRPLPARKVLRALEALGFQIVRQKGRHAMLVHPDGRSTVVPVHPGQEIGRDCSARSFAMRA
ncbi:MAG TPA: type II toxin-antitoxin system HicA family toxin [Thermoplasmata archaeon]|nr:type II toxin-antitoxin system HicA family toxin [Thermoplasmata archaeon]